MSNFKVRFVPLGGIVGVTKNMYLYELYRDNELQDILIVDCGIGFPKEQDLGVDIEIPDISYLKDKVDKIRGVVLTHGHEDHITGLRFHYNDLGKPQIYTGKLTSIFVRHKCKENNINPNITLISFDKTYSIGGFDIKFIRMTHSIPDTTHVLIKSPVGNFYHGSDYKIDLTPPFGYSPDFYEIAKAGKEGVLCLLSDCLGADRDGFTRSESIVGQTFEDEIRSTKGKFIMTTFASNISRVRQCAEAAMKFNRKICLLGRSMRNNTRLVKDIGYFPIPKKFMISEKEVNKHRPNQICIIATGSQGQYNAAISRLATNQNKHISVEKGDKIVFSSDPIPGNETAVYDLIEHLYLLGADIKYTDIHDELHASGHGSQGDMLLLMQMVKAKHLIPIGGTVRFQRHYLELAKQAGYNDQDVHLLQEGQTLWFEQGKARAGKSIETKKVYVDAYGVGDLGDTILRDRMTLSTEGVVFAVVKTDAQNKLAEKPEFVSRGFLSNKDDKSEKVFHSAGQEVGRMFQKAKNGAPLKRDIIRGLERHFLKKTNKKPLVVMEMVRV